MKHINIKGYGKYLPSQILSNDDLSKMVETSDEWITQRTGIKERRISSSPTSYLAYQASLKALQDANMKPNDIDAIIVATMTPDNITPSVACLVQKQLGIEKDQMLAFDLNGACTGLIYALNVASALLVSGKKNILVVASETMSRIVDFKDRNTCILFGDGASAFVLSSEGNHSMDFYTNSIGNDEHLICSSFPTNEDYQATSLQSGFLKMNGKEVFKFAVSANIQAITELLKTHQMTIDDIDLFVFHQANIRILDYVCRKLNINKDKVFVNLDKYGNTCAASVGIALSEAYEQGRVKSSQNILLTGFGAGLTYGAALIRKDD